MNWISSTIPGCHEYPCEELWDGSNVVRVWQTSKITTPGYWSWSLNNDRIHITKGNRGIAKSIAKRMLLSLVSLTQP
jgi:hypothetical protein